MFYNIYIPQKLSKYNLYNLQFTNNVKYVKRDAELMQMYAKKYKLSDI